jgi:hypothetical protein
MSIRGGLVRRLNERDRSAAMAPAARRQEELMRFMSIAKSPHSGPPTPELLKAMDKLAEQEIKAGCLLDHRGLMPLVPNHSNATTRPSGLTIAAWPKDAALMFGKCVRYSRSLGKSAPQLRKLEP